MNENDVFVETEPVTTPTSNDENNGATATAETDAGTVETAAETTETTADDEASTAEQVTTPAQEDAEAAAQPILIPVKYKGEDMNLTVDEATTRIQRGMMLDEKLHRLATDCGKGVDDFINDLYEARDNATYQRLLNEAHGDEGVAKRLLELERQKQNAAYKKAQDDERAAAEAAKNAVNERLASDFIELKAEFPQYGSFSELPKAVVKMAVDKNISLYDAMLRHERAENKKIDTAKQQQAQAASASVGSQANTSTAGETDPLIAAMMGGIHSAL